jgi:hypothetical protein
MRENDKANIISIAIAVIIAGAVIVFSNSEIVVVGKANRVWAIEIFVLTSVTTGCLLSYIRKQRRNIRPTFMDNVWDMGTPLFTGYISMQMYTWFAGGSL